MDKEYWLNDFPICPWDNAYLKYFFASFLQLPCNTNYHSGAVPTSIHQWWYSLAQYAKDYSIFIPLLHTLWPNRLYGDWWDDVPNLVQSNTTSATDGHLATTLCYKATGFISNSMFSTMIYASSHSGINFLHYITMVI